jgi:tetratricopeptide (TPR) repeat protein
MNERDIFTAAHQLQGAAERDVFLDAACAGDQELRRRIVALLEEQAHLGSFLEHDKPPAVTVDDSIAERTGTVIGPYKLLEPIGEGGMGTVWMAQQTEPVKRLVAVKLIKAGMDSKQVIARFEAERQALALMDHPNIAKVLDGGTTPSGRPYFVMDLVKGVPITRYCDEHHLTPRQRLELFLPICQAVQHAHQKGIIHRDLKPSNVLVALYDGKPVPKVIDFGVAKAAGQSLTDKTLVTGLGNIVGTLEYMSPEQAEVNQLDIDTRSDIYSLGVLLYELLTGSPPFSRKELEKAGMLEMLRVIREQEPSKPSTKLSTAEGLPTVAANRGTEPAKLTRLLRGELDWIVMKALEKDRNRRYETANGFAMDVQRYVADEPVQACPPSAGYRLRKFARRNKGGLAVAALVLFFLVLLGSGVGWAVRDRSARQANVAGQVELTLAEVERLEKEQRWSEALAAVQRAEAVVTGGDADAQTAHRVRERLRDLAFIDRLEQIRMQRAAVVDWNFDNAGADRDYGRAFRDYGVDVEELAVEASIARLKARPAFAIPLAAALDDWANARGTVSTVDGAAWKRLVAIARGIDPEPLRDRVRATWGRPVSEVQDERRKMVESINARAQHPATLLLLARLRGVQFSDTGLRLLREAQDVYPGDFWIQFDLGYVLSKQKDYEGAIRFYTAAVAIRPNSVAAHNNLGNALQSQKKPDEAIRHYRKAIEIDPNFAAGYYNLGNALHRQKKLDEAIAAYRKAIDLDPKVAKSHNNLGNCYLRLDDYVKALECYFKALEFDPQRGIAYENLINLIFFDRMNVPMKRDEAIVAFRKTIASDPRNANAYIGLGLALQSQGKAEGDQNKRDEALAALRTATQLAPTQAHPHYILGTVQMTLREYANAANSFRGASAINPKIAAAHNSLGLALRGQQKLEEAITAFREAISVDPNFVNAHGNLGIALRDQKKLPEAIAAFRKALEIDPDDYRVRRHLAIALGMLGDELHGQKKLEEAIAAYREAVQLNPNDVVTHRNLGTALRNKEDLPGAIAAFRKVIELDPKDAAARGNLAIALQLRGWELINSPAVRNGPKIPNSKPALDPVLEAVELAPQSEMAWQFLGWVQYRVGDWRASIEALEKSCQVQKGSMGDSGQWIVLALAHGRLAAQEGLPDKARERHQAEARRWFEKADRQIDTWWRARPGHDEVSQSIWDFRAEARELMSAKQDKK